MDTTSAISQGRHGRGDALNRTHQSSKAGELRSRLLEQIRKGTTDWEAIEDYGRLCRLVRRRDNPVMLPSSTLFRIRTGLENNIMKAALADPDRIFKGHIFGVSSKQGVSFRLGLNACSPSALCKDRCYAHDGRDALPQAVQRGALNSALFRLLDGPHAADHLEQLRPHVRRAVLSAARHADEAWAHYRFRRPPRIRFAHAGDVCKWPKAANLVGRLVQDVAREMRLPGPKVRLVCYTKYLDPKLDPDSWIVNISRDPSTQTKVTPGANQNVTWTAFDGALPPNPDRRGSQRERTGIDVVFVEHIGQWRGKPPAKTRYFICPATQAGNPHSCDANRCHRCFRTGEKGATHENAGVGSLDSRRWPQRE